MSGALSFIKKFREQKLEDWSWLKKVSKRVLAKEVKKLCPGFEFKVDPWEHQLAAFVAGIYNDDGFLFLLDMGTGKSKIVIDLFSWWKKERKVKTCLIIAERKAHIDEWEEHVKDNCDLSYTLLDETTDVNKQLLKEKSSIFIVSSGSIRAICTSLVTTTGKKRKRVLDPVYCRELSKKFDMIIIDESHNIKNSASLIWKVCYLLSENAFNVSLLTGTPFEKNYTDLFAQYLIVDEDQTLGTMLEKLELAYFKVTPGRYGGKEVALKKEYEEAFIKRLHNKALLYSEEEIKDIPPSVDTIIKLTFSMEMATLYDEVVEGAIQFINNKGNISKNVYAKLRQITAGFYYYNEDGKRKVHRLKDIPKIDALLGKIEDMPVDKKVLIFVEHIEAGNIVSEALVKAGYKIAKLYGKVDDAKEEKNEFKYNKNVKAFVVSWESGSSCLSLQKACHYTFNYEQTQKVIKRKQGKKRTNRGGQQNTTFHYDFIMRNSVEEKILKSVKQGICLYDKMQTGDVKLKDLRRK